ncbi:MAG: hypothetical protein ACYCQJ_02630 [Nitrososphaerales archaeon]
MSFDSFTLASRVNQSQNGVALEVLDNASLIASGPTSQEFFDVCGATKAELLITIGANSGGTSPTIQFFIDVIDIVSGAVIKTYNGTQITNVNGGVDYISIDGKSVLLGDYIQARWTLGGSVLGTWNGVYARLVIKR